MSKLTFPKNHILLLCIGIGLLLSLLAVGTPDDDPRKTRVATETNQSKLRIAEYYAPLIFHDTDDDDYPCDYFTKINFDGDYDTRNNWVNNDDYDLPAYVYYSVSSTATHYFIGYFFYHARDCGPFGAVGSHDNDLEGIFLMVNRQRGTGMGELVGLVTEAHNEYYQYAYCPDRNQNGNVDKPENGNEYDATIKSDPAGEDIDGCFKVYTTVTETACNAQDTASGGCVAAERRLISLPDGRYKDGVHPMIFIEAEGHGVTVCGDDINLGLVMPEPECVDARGGDGIVYYYGNVAGIPSSGSGNYTNKISYSLIAMDAGSLAPGTPGEDQGLWYLQNPAAYQAPSEAYWRFGTFRGSSDQHSAKGPWLWDDPNDNQVYAGGFFCDPAFAFDTHLNGSEFDNSSVFSREYLDHVYYTHYIDISAVMIDANKGDIYLTMEAEFDSDTQGKFITEENWKIDNMTVNQWHTWSHGNHDAVGPQTYASDYGDRYICRPPDTRFLLRSWDSDIGPDQIVDPYLELNASDLPFEGDSNNGTTLGHVSLKFRIDWNAMYFSLPVE